jgi:homoserine kinase
VLLKIQEHLKLAMTLKSLSESISNPEAGSAPVRQVPREPPWSQYFIRKHFSKDEMVHFAMFGEELVSGIHADNIAPCLYGGSLSKILDPIDIIPLNSPELFVAAVHPQVEVKTSDSRQILKKNIF